MVALRGSRPVPVDRASRRIFNNVRSRVQASPDAIDGATFVGRAGARGWSVRHSY